MLLSKAWRRLLAPLMVVAAALPAVAAIPLAEEQVLRDLYDRTNGAAWTDNTNWGGPHGTECTWYGITCDAGENHVLRVTLPSNNLDGPLLIHLNDLTALEEFNVQNNSLRGAIPSLTGMTNLRALAVNGNQLSGSIPSLSGLTALTWFYVYSNQLSGPIPPLTGLTALEYFAVDDNDLSSTIPPLTGLTALRYFIVNDNQLSGPMPSLAGLPPLERVFVHNNQLTGAPPAAPATLTAGFSRLCPNFLSVPSPTEPEWSIATAESPWSTNCTAAPAVTVPTLGEWALVLTGLLAVGLGMRRLRRPNVTG